MKIIIFGASGMVGQGVLRECLLDPEVESVLAVTRATLGTTHPKLREIIHKDFTDFTSLQNQLQGFDACFYCLGISSVGLSEDVYTRITYGYTVAAAQLLAKLNPGMTFVFVSGMGADSSEKGGIMWARVKGKAENAVLTLPFKAVYVFRPNIIQPLHGIKSRTKIYQVFYDVMGPILSLMVKYFPRFSTTTERIGRAMIRITKEGHSKRILEGRDINKYE